MKGFDAEKYLIEQKEHILKRIEEQGGERLYLEFGGKLGGDKHAARVLPGYDENSKIKLLCELADKAEIIICIRSDSITTKKTRNDFGISYDLEVLRLIDTFRRNDLPINSVVVTLYEDQPAVNYFINKLNRRGIKTYKHYYTKGYPTDVETIVSDEGYGANPYIEVSKPLIVVADPGGGSGKLATCLSQLYHENKRGKRVSYAKFETFPVWNLPLKHPINIAYEAATADLKDVNMIDSFHLDCKVYNFPTGPFVLGLLLGNMMEANFRRALVMSHGKLMTRRPSDRGPWARPPAGPDRPEMAEQLMQKYCK